MEIVFRCLKHEEKIRFMLIAKIQQTLKIRNHLEREFLFYFFSFCSRSLSTYATDVVFVFVFYEINSLTILLDG